MRNGGRFRIASLSGIIVSIYNPNDSAFSILIFLIQGARKKIRHQGKQGDLEQNVNLQDSLGTYQTSEGSKCNQLLLDFNIRFVEPLGLHSIGPQNLLDRNNGSVDHESLTTGVQDYNPMFREPWAPCDLTKPATPLDMAWSSMLDPASTPTAQPYPYNLLNLFQPNLPSSNSHTPNSSNPDPLSSGSGLQPLYSSCGNKKTTAQQSIGADYLGLYIATAAQAP